jgi:sulfur dioxygenase
MLFRQLFDQDSGTYTYLIADTPTKQAVLVDPVIEQVERELQLIKELGLNLSYCLETHIHADHITGTSKLREQTGCLGVLPENAHASCADRLIKDGEVLQIGDVKIQAIATPGHTDSHMVYLVNNTHLLTGDCLFFRGCGRTDFQGGNAGAMYDSITQRLFTLPNETLVYPGHDYKGHTVSNLPNPKKIMEAVPANERCGNI